MYILILYLPFLSFFLSGFFGKFLGSKGAGIITVFCMSLTVCLSFFIFYEVALLNSLCNFKLFPWIHCEFLELSWGLLFDSLTCVMLLVVNIVSLLVHIFSLNYMKNDPHLTRFMSYLSLFTFFMLILVTADNYVQMFVGWEGVGLASYLLINFWFTRFQANKSSLKAVILNRFGDFGLVLGLACIFFIFKTFDYSIIFSTAPYFQNDTLNFFLININIFTFICFFLFIGAVGKSAQMGLHVWLPDAMEGPTPVSALIHAATMVTAGVFLLIRSSPLLEFSGVTLNIIATIGALTAFFAATTGLVQNDLKKVIAYSTCSQLGYMVFVCGLSSYSVSLFHLMNHAFFKALLFLSAGAVIHALSDEQDMRKMGGLYKVLPFVYTMFLIGSLALMGFPFLTGFYSKDVILEISFATYNVYGLFSFWLGTLSAFFTAFYSFRLLFLTFLSKPNGFKKSYETIHEIDIYMGIPLITLAFGSIFVGYLFKDLIIGLGSRFWNNVLFFLPENSFFLVAEFIPIYIKILPVFLSILGGLSALYIYIKCSFYLYNFCVNFNFGFFLYLFLNKKWFFDLIYYYFIVYPSLYFGYNISFVLIDRGFIEIFGPLGFVRLFNRVSYTVNLLNTGFLFNYGFICILFLFFFSIFLLLFNYILFIFSINLLFISLCLILILFFSFKYKNIFKIL